MPPHACSGSPYHPHHGVAIKIALKLVGFPLHSVKPDDHFLAGVEHNSGHAFAAVFNCAGSLHLDEGAGLEQLQGTHFVLGRRVFADVDEMHLARLTPGAKVEVTFRGNKTIFTGRIARAPLAIARTKRSDADLGEVNAPHLVEIEIELDNTSAMPQLLGNESRVTFL